MSSENSRRIVKNTSVLYLQMVCSSLIGLYTSRVILNVLGVEDFGIFNAIGGVVALFGILNAAMSSSSSRFITYELGSGNLEKLRAIFSTSFLIHLALGLIVCLITLPIGAWFIQVHMKIPAVRLDAGLWVFFSVVATTFFSVLSVPFNAIIIAHERMHVYAFFTILDLILKLIIVLSLTLIPFDKLKVYGILLVISQLIMQGIYWMYCYKSFNEARIKMEWDKVQFKEMTSFAGWSLFGDSAYLFYTQGLNVLLNVFFGAPVNAARGIAVQVQGLLMRLTNGFQTSINPQITKSYASGDFAYMSKLIFTSSKYSFFLFLLFAIPVFLEGNQLLVFWLKVVPPHTLAFIRLILMIALLDCLANPLIASVKASGKIKKYQAVLGSLLLLIVPISYFFLKLGFPPESVFVVQFFVALIGQCLRIILARPLIEISLYEYGKKVIIKCVVGLVLIALIPSWLYFSFDESLFRLSSIVVTSMLSTIVIVFFFISDHEERKWISSRLLFKGH